MKLLHLGWMPALLALLAPGAAAEMAGAGCGTAGQLDRMLPTAGGADACRFVWDSEADIGPRACAQAQDALLGLAIDEPGVHRACAAAWDLDGDGALDLVAADLDGDGMPDLVCTRLRDSSADACGIAADFRAQAHELCHTVQQGSPAQRACDGPAEVVAMAGEARRDAALRCWNQVMALPEVAALGAQSQVLHAPAVACAALLAGPWGYATPTTCMMAGSDLGRVSPDVGSLARTGCDAGIQAAKSKHDAAMAAIQNTR